MHDTNTMQKDVSDPLSFVADEVTGMRSLDVDGIDGHRTACDVADSLASMLELPTNTPYALRDNKTARMMAGDVSLGSQIEQTGTRLTVIPKSHLG